MAAIVLKVTPEELQSTAGEFKNKNSQVQSYTSNMLQLIRGITAEVWSGEAATAYISKFTGLENDITTLCSKLDKETTNLLEIAAQYKSAEAANVAAASALSSSVIS